MCHSDVEIIKKLKKEMEAVTKSVEFNFREDRNKFAVHYNEEIAKFKDIISGNAGMSFEKPDIIHIKEDLFDLKIFALIPLILDEVETVGTYRVFIGGKDFGTVTYKGLPDNSGAEEIILVGVITELNISEPVHYIKIEFNMDDIGAIDRVGNE